MGLTNSLLIGRSALQASQVALQVTGNNIANAATAGYHRQRVMLEPSRSDLVGVNQFVGRGTGVREISRVIDPALQARVRSSISDEAAASVAMDAMTTIESLTNELTGIDLSTELSRFFNAFSELANNPAGTATRTAVVEQGASLASYLRSLRTDLVTERDTLDAQIVSAVERADQLVDEIAGLNGAIVNSELGRGEEGALRDQRDRLVTELTELIDATVVERETGAVDVLVASVPVVQGNVSRGLETDLRSSGGELTLRVRTSSNPEELDVISGRVGGLLEQRANAFGSTIDDLDEVAAQLIFQVNTLHTSGRPESGVAEATGWRIVQPADLTVALNDPANATMSEARVAAKNGSFSVTVTDADGRSSTTQVFVDLDGIDGAGLSGFGDDTSIADVLGDISAIANLNTSLTAEGRVRITADAGYEVSFGDDTSGVLALLGINTFFQGDTAADIAVRGELRDDTGLLVVGNGLGSNDTALAIAGLRDRPLDAFSGATISERWSSTVERNAVRTAAATTRFEALSSVRSSLEAQEQAISGVSLDEESINLITYQQQYSGAARFIQITDELTNILLSIV